MNAEDLQAARERDGAAAEDRPARVDEILEPKERIGYKNELPLLDREYSAYPEGDDILRPEAGDALETLADHPLVSGVEDMSDELNTPVGKVEKATDLHAVELPEDGFDVEVDTSRLDTLIGDIPEDMVSSENPILTAILYVEKGLGTGEIADVLGEVTDSNVREADVRQALTDARVLEGETTAEAEYRRKQARGEVGGYDNGVTIDTTDL
jgi:hypothetical protein